MSKQTLLAVLALATLGCRTSMNKRPDASPAPEAGRADATLDLLNVPDVSLPDGGPADKAPLPGVPHAFRIVNRTALTIYVRGGYALGCQVASTSGWQTCTYFHSCSMLCPRVQSSQDCCVECEQDVTVYAIAAGQSRLWPWDGTIFMKETGLCTECQCDQPIAAPDGHFQASAHVYTSYECLSSGCQVSSDGKIEMAILSGAYRTVSTRFDIPSVVYDEVVISVQPSDEDAGSNDRPADALPADAQPALDTPADAPLADSARDLATEPTRSLLSEVAGRSFQIAASEARPDASQYGRSCATSNPGALYRLTFSDDGSKVTVVRTDPVQEVNLTGTLKTSSSSQLTYDLTPAFAGASLVVWRDGDDLIGELAMHGSGAPIIWCIESPMRPL